MPPKRKAVALLSGGLDSTLAVKMMQQQGIEIVALNFVTPFCNCNRHGRCQSKHVADQFKIPLKIISGQEDYLEIIKNPRYGYGKHMNPCLDCRIFMYKKAKAYMEEIGASFVFTGEVLGQRPMSQRMDAMKLVERESGLSGKLLRPLSGKFFSETDLERELEIDRQALGDIQGRSRKKQIDMAKDFGIVDYACPAGGCLLTDEAFAKRLRDLFKNQPEVKVADVLLLKVGRHLRLSPEVKIVVGRNHQENLRIQQLATAQDLILSVKEIPGPLTLVRGNKIDSTIKRLAAGVCVRYSDYKDKGETLVDCVNKHDKESISVPVLTEDQIKIFMI